MKALPPLLLMFAALCVMYWGVIRINTEQAEARQACEARVCAHGVARVISDTCVCVEVPK